ncbi:MAG: iron-containing redox enzyme family protein [Myxococcota bacterium]
MKSIAKNFHEVAKAHPLWGHEFLQCCRRQELSRTQVETLAVQMYAFCKNFHRVLEGILARCPDVEARTVILENLHDELGKGDPRLAHPALFRHFTQALGIDDAALEATSIEPETQALVDTYMGLAERYGYVAALGAVCFASEGIVAVLYAQVLRGIMGARPLSREALVFFEEHIQVDDGHAAKLAALIKPRVHSPQEVELVERAIVEALDARCRFFDGIQRRSAELSCRATAA